MTAAARPYSNSGQEEDLIPNVAPAQSNNPLSALATRVPQTGQPGEDGSSQQNLHQQHFVQTVQAL